MVSMAIKASPGAEDLPFRPSDTEPSSSSLDRKVNVLFQAISKLSHHGVDAIADVSVPKIAMIGDQSAGKSSLVEAISEIKVPRDVGTCTRCPLEINLANEPGVEWTASISLLKVYIFDPECDPTANEFHPWIRRAESVSPSPFMDSITCQDDLEDAIRKAQLATLTPNCRHEEFVTGRRRPKSSPQAPFSPNSVIIQIRGKHLPNLSFIDLPGVISQSDEGPNVVNLVRRLASHYIKQENTLVLLAISMENDIMNSAASGLVNELDADHRCMGVLTKPDRLGIQDVTQWKEVLTGVKFPRGLGYYVAKQPIHNKNMSYQAARKAEMTFFDSEEWLDKFPANFENRLGTLNLQAALSNTLAEWITRDIPEIYDKVQSKLEVIEQRVGELPPEKHEHAFYEINNIVQRYQAMVDAKRSHEQHDVNDIRESYIEARASLKEEILDNLRPVIHHGHDLGLPLSLKRKAPADECDKQPVSSTNTPSKPASNEIINLDDDTCSPPTPSPSKRAHDRRKGQGAGSRSLVLRSPAKGRPTSQAFTCGQIKGAIDKFQLPGLPGEVNPKGLNSLILSTIRGWDVPVQQIFNKLKTRITKSLLGALSGPTACGPWINTPLHTTMKATMHQFVSQLIAQEMEKALEAARRESFTPIINDEDHFDSLKDQEFKRLQQARAEQRGIGQYSAETWNKVDERQKRKFVEQLGPDPFDREVEVMAKLKAYYRMAGTRFVDTVFMIIEAGLLQGLSGLKGAIEKDLRLLENKDQAHWDGLLEQDPVRIQERKVLCSQHEALSTAFKDLQDLLDKLGVSYPDGDVPMEDSVL